MTLTKEHLLLEISKINKIVKTRPKDSDYLSDWGAYKKYAIERKKRIREQLKDLEMK
jgi:hypothetical protein